MCFCFDSRLMIAAFSFPERPAACNAISEPVTCHGPEICSVSMDITRYMGQDSLFYRLTPRPIHVMVCRKTLIEAHLFNHAKAIKSWTYLFDSVFSLLLLFWKYKSRLRISPYCLCVLWVPLIHFWMPEPIFMYIVKTEPIWTVYFINPSHQSVCLYAR
jgi:hypothetical protein